ncbi:MAG TPA: PRC and DUF2382 domain-containing protein [Solirubrobacteraceae bacterium]|jgi:uncharacterized protein (TIGR02271 family)|nr:PRC and DUF2382 domain-containing protein [Solirubrobacteraceae bacterium]
MTTMSDAYTWQGRNLLGADGEKIGEIKEIYEDSNSGKPEWALVSSGFLGTSSHFVPLAGAAPDGEDVRSTATKDQVKAAPSIEGGGQLSEEDERRLFEHYGMPYTNEGSVTAEGAPQTGGNGAYDGHDTSGPNTDDAMTRSEEELRVGKTSQERGRARLRKHVTTEQVQTTVPVQREEVRLEREPITDANVDQALDGPEISEEEHEVVLHEEQPVVEKRVVPKERVALRKDTVTDEHQVSEQVRKEQIESEGEEL